MKGILALAMGVGGALALQGCSIFYDAHYSDERVEINEYGLLGHLFPTHTLDRGPYGLLPIMRETRLKPGVEPLPGEEGWIDHSGEADPTLP